MGGAGWGRPGAERVREVRCAGRSPLCLSRGCARARRSGIASPSASAPRCRPPPRESTQSLLTRLLHSPPAAVCTKHPPMTCVCLSTLAALLSVHPLRLPPCLSPLPWTFETGARTTSTRTQTPAHTRTGKQTDTHTGRQTDIVRHVEREPDRQTRDRQTDRQRYRRTDSQRRRGRDRERGKERETGRDTATD